MATSNTPSLIGKIYTIKTRKHCRQDGIQYIRPPGKAAYHMVLCISDPDRSNMVTVATLSTKNWDQNWEHHPFFPNTDLSSFPSSQILYFKNYTSASSSSPLSHPTFLRLDPFLIPHRMLLPTSPKKSLEVPSWEAETVWEGDRLLVETWLDEEHLELTPESLGFVLGRMRVNFAHSFPLAPPWNWRSGQVDMGLGSGKDRLAKRMGISTGNLEKRLDWIEGYQQFWR
ncbi:hypothetical protein EG327_009545 [Venturia inaequalis]|uniref:Uncharacterized protein n=1 Tax=Venturia inaequalis TaxID=5025 RepID=A0A8H3VSY8_VENIN|nr:hypothetical protein EG327_009545 [Venturia inaequalis]